MKLLLIGLSHKTTPLEIRERLSLPPAALRPALTHFGPIHPQAHLEDVREGVILSTCNRLEIYALVYRPERAAQAILNFLGRSADLAPEIFKPYLYILEDEAVVRHLLRVAAGLDSMVMGEPQILGQVTEAYELALSQEAAGTVLSALCRAAIHTGKRARTETGIGVNSVSISSVAANLAGRLLGNLPERQVVLIGAGEMGAIAVRALAQRGLSQITVVNRTYEKAEQLAEAWNGRAATFQQLPTLLRTADIVITSTGAPHTILSPELLAPVMKTRPNRPLFLIDIAVPRDIDPEVARLSKIHLYDIDDLQEQANQNIRDREAEIPHVEAIVREEVAAFMTWLASLEATSTITHLRQKVEEVRQQELERLFKRLNLTEQEQSLVAAMSQRLTHKILHEPTLCLKQETANGNGAAFISATRQLFALDQTHSTGSGQAAEEEPFINPKERIPCDNSFASLAMI